LSELCGSGTEASGVGRARCGPGGGVGQGPEEFEQFFQAAQESKVGRFFYASSACVYNADKQKCEDVVPLKEEDAYPAMPEDGYGWEKLFSERMCRHFREDYGLYTRVARFHNVYGPHGTWDSCREKAPAAICWKVFDAKAKGADEIEIWGDGKQTRSFMYIEDCIKGIRSIMDSDILEPINLGSDEITTIIGLADMVEEIAGMKLKYNHNLDAPKGVNGRNSDNTLIRNNSAGPLVSVCVTAWKRHTLGSSRSIRRNTQRTLCDLCRLAE